MKKIIEIHPHKLKDLWVFFQEIYKNLTFEVSNRGWGNEYVKLPKWHPYYEKNYEEIPINCYGGLTYSGLDDDENYWVIGFDTNHYNDDIIIWSVDYVIKETHDIMLQCCNIKEVSRMLKFNKLIKIKNDG